jgi:hypothetical protein
MAKVTYRKNPMADQITRNHVDPVLFFAAMQRASKVGGTCESVAKELSVSVGTVLQKMYKYRKNPKYQPYVPLLQEKKATKRIDFDDEEATLAILRKAAEESDFTPASTITPHNPGGRGRPAKSGKK